MQYTAFPDAYFGSARKTPATTITPQELDRNIAPFRRHLARFIKTLPQNAVVLDAGCGSGKAARMVRVYRPDITVKALDISDVSEFLPSEVEFKIGSVEEVHTLFGEEVFDAIICLHVIEHLPYPMQMILSFRSALKPGGAVFFETPNWTRLFIPFSHMFFWNDYTHVRPFSPFAMTKLLSEFEFGVEKLITVGACQWFVPRLQKAPTTSASHQVSSSPKADPNKSRGLFFRIVARVLNPLMRDTLIAVGRKSK